MRVVNLRVVTLFLFGMFAMAMVPGQAWFGAPVTAIGQDDPFGDSTKRVAQDDPFASSEPARGTVTRRQPAVSHDDVASASKASDASSNAESNSPSAATKMDDVIRQKLLQTCDFDLLEVSFVVVKEELEERLGVNIVLTSSACDDSLDEDETFTSSLSGVTHASALRILLADKNATYCVRDGVIQMISLDEAYDEQWCSRRMINVSETLDLIRVAEKHRIGKPVPGSIRVDAQVQSGGGGGVFAIQVSGTPAKKPTVKRTTETKEIQQLADAIVRAVKDSQPKVQRTVKLVTAESILIDAIQASVIGDYGQMMSITCVGGVLIAKAPEEVNDRVESFVEDLTFIMKNSAAKKR